MEDGLVQLIFILLIVFAAILDFFARSREKRKRMDRMEEEELGEADSSWGAEEQQWEAEGRPQGGDGGASGEEQGERRTADTMVPSDLWEEILGGAGGTTARREEAPPEPAPRPPQEDRPATNDPHRPEPVDLRRREPVDPHRPPPREHRVEAGSQEASLPDLRQLTERQLLERAKGEERRARLEKAAARKAKRPAAPREHAGRFADLFRSGDREALRRAIVYREVLGKPLALRESGSGGWEEEEA